MAAKEADRGGAEQGMTTQAGFVPVKEERRRYVPSMHAELLSVFLVFAIRTSVRKCVRCTGENPVCSKYWKIRTILKMLLTSDACFANIDIIIG